MQNSTAHVRQLIQRSVRSDKLRELALGAVDAGFDGYLSGTNHLRLVNPANGVAVWMSMTSNGAARAYKNTRAALKRAGYIHEETQMPKGQRATQAQIDIIRAGKAAGLRNEEIAKQAGLSTKAVTTYTPLELRQVHPKAQVPGSTAVMDRQDPTATTPSGQEYVRGHQPGIPASPEQITTIRAMAQEGKANKDIALATGLSTWTVSKYRSSYKKPEQPHLETLSGPEIIPPNNDKPDRETTEVSDRLVVYSEPTVDQRAEQPMDIADVVLGVTREYEHFPTIRGLVARQRHLGQLLQLAEKSGDEDVQLLVMQKMELSGLEKEAVELWTSTHGATNGHAPDA